MLRMRLIPSLLKINTASGTARICSLLLGLADSQMAGICTAKFRGKKQMQPEGLDGFLSLIKLEMPGIRGV